MALYLQVLHYLLLVLGYFLQFLQWEKIKIIPCLIWNGSLFSCECKKLNYQGQTMTIYALSFALGVFLLSMAGATIFLYKALKNTK